MFHTFVGYLHGRLTAEDEEEKRKSSKVINKMQGLVSMMIMKKKQNVMQINGKGKVQYLILIMFYRFINDSRTLFLIMNSCDLGYFSIFAHLNWVIGTLHDL